MGKRARVNAVPGALVRRLVATVAGLAGLAACGHGSASGPAAGTPSPAAPKPASTAAHVPAPHGVPIEVRSHRVGSKYVVWTKQKQNRKVYVLRADSEAGTYSGADTGRSDFVNPHITFYGTNGKRIVAEAPAGTVVEKDKTVRMRGGVRSRTQDGTTLSSDTLRYDDDTETMHGEGNVVVRFPGGEELRGAQLDWNLRDGHLAVGGAR